MSHPMILKEIEVNFLFIRAAFSPASAELADENNL
jgi:hypothetical protein